MRGPRWRWRRRLLIAGDAALALALAALSVALTVTLPPGPTGSDPAVPIALALLQTLPLVFRRWRPVWVLAIVVTATAGHGDHRRGWCSWAGRPAGGSVLGGRGALPAGGGRRPGRASPPGAALALPLLRHSGGLQSLEQIGLGLTLQPWVFRRWGGCARRYVSELRGRAARSRREQELETGRAVAEEQARVGRELHDVIAHTLSVIVIQAGAALDVFDTSPRPARQALGSIGAAGQAGPGSELRRVLQAVRPQAEQEGWAPQPGLVRSRRAAVPRSGPPAYRDRPHRRHPGGPARRAGPGRLPHRAGGPDEHAQARAGGGQAEVNVLAY